MSAIVANVGFIKLKTTTSTTTLQEKKIAMYVKDTTKRTIDGFIFYKSYLERGYVPEDEFIIKQLLPGSVIYIIQNNTLSKKCKQNISKHGITVINLPSKT